MCLYVDVFMLWLLTMVLYLEMLNQLLLFREMQCFKMCFNNAVSSLFKIFLLCYVMLFFILNIFQNFGPVTLQKEVNPAIQLVDKNDEMPYFRGTNIQRRYPGSVPENMPAGQDVITITGYDNDIGKAFSDVGVDVK